MSDDFYTMVDSGDPAPDNEHITGVREKRGEEEQAAAKTQAAMYAARIAVYDDMLSTPRVIVIEPKDVRTYLEETTNTVYQCIERTGRAHLAHGYPRDCRKLYPRPLCSSPSSRS